ncbi:MAG: hypothetical protein HY517_00875 [Candidatus Aenigmarchaeota archaeon]|nr:hypothetical protein [Candidatus Aenigmarchaeota archaeon]
MIKKDIVFGIANGIIIFVILFFADKLHGFVYTKEILPTAFQIIILAAEFLILRFKNKNRGIAFYVISFAISWILLLMLAESKVIYN